MKRRRGYTRLSGKNQVTIPVAALDRVGLEPGHELKVEVENGRIVLEPVLSLTERRREAVRRTKGALTDVYEPGYFDRLRDEWR